MVVCVDEVKGQWTSEWATASAWGHAEEPATQTQNTHFIQAEKMTDSQDMRFTLKNFPKSAGVELKLGFMHSLLTHTKPFHFAFVIQ